MDETPADAQSGGLIDLSALSDLVSVQLGDQTIPVLIAVIAGVVAMIVIGLFRLLLRRRHDFPYVARDGLFTPAEFRFLGVLDQAVGSQYRIMGKVRLADLMAVRKGLDSSRRQIAQNKINHKHVDFVLLDGEGQVLLAIELDDLSHQRADRQASDRFKDGAFAAAGLPLLRVPVRRSYDPVALAREVRSALQAADPAPDASRRRPPVLAPG